MSCFATAAVIFVLAVAFLAPEARGFHYTANGTETPVEISHWVLFKSRATDQKADAEAAIVAQLKYLESGLALSKTKAQPKDQGKFQILQIEKINKQLYRASYRYEGLWLMDTQYSGEVSVALPNEPIGFFERDAIQQGSRLLNPCAPENHNWAEYFWINWDPSLKGCSQKEGKEYFLATVRLGNNLPGTVKTYPEYERLKGPDGKIDIFILVGTHHADALPNPLKKNSDELNTGYQEIRDFLTDELKFDGRRLSKNEVKAFYFHGEKSSPPSAIPFMEEFIKASPQGTMRIRMVFLPVSNLPYRQPFSHLLKYALENSSVILYSGHSGYGEYLDLKTMEKQEKFSIQMPLDRYQIAAFDACTSYSLYLAPFFSLKISVADPHGTRNLDILSSGLDVEFSKGGHAEIEFLRAIDAWAFRNVMISYQEIIDAGDVDPETDAGNLWSVDGDEDNPLPPGVR